MRLCLRLINDNYNSVFATNSYIAIAVGRNNSTISREIFRNTGQQGYRFKQVDEKENTRSKKAVQNSKKCRELMGYGNL